MTFLLAIPTCIVLATLILISFFLNVEIIGKYYIKRRRKRIIPKHLDVPSQSMNTIQKNHVTQESGEPSILDLSPFYRVCIFIRTANYRLCIYKYRMCYFHYQSYIQFKV